MHAGFPVERIVLELISNVFDEGVPNCTAVVENIDLPAGKFTKVTVEDDSPEGFRNLADAFTLFGSTKKRSDATVRGRFNYGEKIAIARSHSARVSSTKGEIIFDQNGRRESEAKREKGTVVELIMPRWTAEEMNGALSFLRRIHPPKKTRTTINGAELVAPKPAVKKVASLPTELITVLPEGAKVFSRTRRNTDVAYYPKADKKAFLYELGIPVCAIEGEFDIDVGQKIPLSQDRQTVAVSFLQDIYAEALLALGTKIDPKSIGTSMVQLALEDQRIGPDKAVEVIKSIYGEKCLIQVSGQPDSNQEGVRAGFELVSDRTFGATVNAKLREGGLQTTYQRFNRDLDGTSGERERVGYTQLNPDSYTAEQRRFIDYVQFLAGRFFSAETFTVTLGKWSHNDTIAYNSMRHLLSFHVDRVKIANPVSGATSVILHELAHARGNQHDGVYDHEYERLVGEAISLLAREPASFAPFEPELFQKHS